MEWPISIDLGLGVYGDVFLSFRVNFGELMIDYYDSAKEQYLLDKLSSFQRIEFDDLNPLHITFIGDKIKRSFKFKDEDALSNVWTYLQNYVKFQSISGQNRAYLIVPLKKSSLDKKDNYYEESSSQKKNILSKESLTDPEAITSNIILESLPDSEIINVDENNYQNIFDNDGTIKDEYNISCVHIKFDFSFNFWKTIFGIFPSETDFDDYKKLLSQWNPVYSSQWRNNSHLRRFVALFEGDLKNSYFTSDLRKLTFEILMSFYYQKFGRISYEISLYRIVSFLVDSSIVIESRDNNENRFHLHDGDISDRITISVSLFYMFSEIYDRFIDSSNPRYEFISREQFTDNVNDILQEYSPSTLKLLESFEIKNYDFIYQYLQSFLIGGKQSNQEKYLFTAFITAKSKRSFAVNLIAASFIMLHRRLENILFDQPEAFQEFYIALLMKIDDRLLVENTRILVKMSDKDAEAV